LKCANYWSLSKEFIESQHNNRSIQRAVLQEKHLDYFINSDLQENRTDINYIQQWAERHFQTNDYFLNWVKQILKTENFLLFYKYLRFPLPTAKLVKNKIEPQLRRVFKAEDSDFKYDITGKEKSDFISDLNIKDFNEEIFNKLLYKHNSLIVSDLDSEESNKPIRYFVDIDKVVSIQEKNGKILRIAFSGCITYEEKEIDGYVYIDDKVYSFYNEDKELITEQQHDLGYAPVRFIMPDKYKDDCIIRESLFTFIRNDLEEYAFLKNLQKMTDPNGAIPVVTKIATETEDDNDSASGKGDPNSEFIMGSQVAKLYNQNSSVGGGDLQPGTIHEVPLEAIQDADGNINTDAVTNYLNFHYTPIEALEYLNDRIKELENNIIVTIVGDIITGSEQAKNIPQIEKSISVLENTLISLSEKLNRIRKLSDTDMLSLKYGKELVNEVFIHYGTDFFLDSESKLFENLGKAPNALERKNIIVRINQNRYKNNADIYSRQKILYDIMPYVSDVDFDKALSQGQVSEINKDYQLRFTYWIGIFESRYGDIVTFYKDLEGRKSERLVVINNLMIDIIKEFKEKTVEIN
jgi:hypothetical protein